MRWPTPQDYNEAIQAPRTAFADRELAAGAPQLNTLQLPKAVTGNFATVYRVNAGTRAYAVRCFLRDDKEHQARYAAIGAHIASTSLPHLVHFEYQQKGIHIRSEWFPILKMEWVNGTGLDRYISTHYSSSDRMTALADEFVKMVLALQKAQIAHGDLQHGNVLVQDTNGRPSLRVIDYDGMWVPALSGRHAPELGHRNYQHPSRRASDFGPYLDAFSAWSILSSLALVVADPATWAMRSGDEQLLFAKEDYVAPWDSRAMDALQALIAPFDLELSRRLFDLSLESDISGFDAPTAAPVVAHGTVAAASEWWREAAAAPVGAGTANAWWVPVETIAFGSSLGAVRATTVIGLLLFALACLFGFIGAVPLGVAILVGAASLVGVLSAGTIGYRTAPEVVAKRLAYRPVQEAKGDVIEAERLVQAWHAYVQQATLNERRALASTEKKLAELRSSENSQRQAMSKQHAQRLAAARDALSQLDGTETGQMQKALRGIQQTFVASALRANRIEAAAIKGIGASLGRLLASYGFVSATDIATWRRQGGGYYQPYEVVLVHQSGRAVHVPGIGEAKCAALVAWAQACRAKATARAPKALPADEQRTIRARFQAKRMRLQAEEKSAQLEAAHDMEALRTDFAKRIAQTTRDRVTAQQQLARAETPHQPSVRNAERFLGEKKAALSRVSRDFERYSTINPRSFVRSLVGR